MSQKFPVYWKILKMKDFKRTWELVFDLYRIIVWNISISKAFHEIPRFSHSCYEKVHLSQHFSLTGREVQKFTMKRSYEEESTGKFHCVTISHHHVKWPVPQISSENRQTAWLIYQLVHPVLSMDHGEGQVGQILQVANFWFIFFYFAVILT